MHTFALSRFPAGRILRECAPALLVALAFALTLAGCTLPGGSDTTALSGAPQVQLIAPLADARYQEGVPVNIQAVVRNAGADIARVEVVANDAIIATLQTPNADGALSFSLPTQTWQPPGPGVYSISVTAFRADGSNSAPAQVSIQVLSEADVRATAAGRAAASSAETTAIAAAPSDNAAANTATTTAPTTNAVVQPTSQQAAPTTAQQAAPPTAPQLPSNTPQPTAPPPTAIPATATPAVPQAVNSSDVFVNIRSGPSTLFNPAIGNLPPAASADLLAVNPDRSWYRIRYAAPTGTITGWVFAQLVSTTGDLSALAVESGPPIPTLTPTPPPTAIPVTLTFTPPPAAANLVISSVRLEPVQPLCNQTFTVWVRVTNNGTGRSNSGLISVQDVRAADNTSAGTTVGGFPALDAGQQSAELNIPLTVSVYVNEQHRLILVVDSNNETAETNETDNRNDATVYTLAQGACP